MYTKTNLPNKNLEKNKNIELYVPGGICYVCQDE